MAIPAERPTKRRVILIHGAGAHGKSFLEKAITARYDYEEIPYLVVIPGSQTEINRILAQTSRFRGYVIFVTGMSIDFEFKLRPWQEIYVAGGDLKDRKPVLSSTMPKYRAGCGCWKKAAMEDRREERQQSKRHCTDRA